MPTLCSNNENSFMVAEWSVTSTFYFYNKGYDDMKLIVTLKDVKSNPSIISIIA